MQKNLIDVHKYKIDYYIGGSRELEEMQTVPTLEPFNQRMISFIDEISKRLMASNEARLYPDIITLAFWMRQASMNGLKRRFLDKLDKKETTYRIGRGRAFHVAPSNVPVNYAYSLIAGLICGNANVVKIPSKDFPQINIINSAINETLKEYQELSSYIVLIRYGHEKEINDMLSSMADVRIIWGGDETIAAIRESSMNPRGSEITFADRYSIALIDSDDYMKCDSKDKVANDFYNDTFLTDQNACTSPRVVVWSGNKINIAKEVFWDKLHEITKQKYEIQGIQAVNKLNSSYLLAAVRENVEKEDTPDNLIVRMEVGELNSRLMDFKDNSGFFFEYNCNDILELKDICDDLRCQTISYIGDKRKIIPLLKSGIRGVDRIVPVGKTMDFDFIWDGYNLVERLTRIISIR